MLGGDKLFLRSRHKPGSRQLRKKFQTVQQIFPEQNVAKNVVFFQGIGKSDQEYAGVNPHTLEAVAQDLKHVFTERNFAQLIEELRLRNLPCM